VSCQKLLKNVPDPPVHYIDRSSYETRLNGWDYDEVNSTRRILKA
jgi:hypothetical protein